MLPLHGLSAQPRNRGLQTIECLVALARPTPLITNLQH